MTKKLTGALNQYRVPFRFKIVSHPALLDRTDAAVLYVGRRYYRIAAELALDTRAKVAAGMKESVPLFTLPLEGDWPSPKIRAIKKALVCLAAVC